MLAIKSQTSGRVSGFREENAALFLLVALVGLLSLGAGSAHSADPTIATFEDGVYWDGERVTITGTGYGAGAMVYISRNGTLDASDTYILQDTYNAGDGDTATQMTFSVNKGALAQGGMYLFVTYDADLSATVLHRKVAVM